MSEFVQPPSSTTQSGWLNNLEIRHLTSDDLVALEWDGEYTHFRRVYNQVYNRMRNGLALMWGADLQQVGLIGQAFVQFNRSSSPSIPNKSESAYIHSFRVKSSYRRMGIGSAIMDNIEGDLILRGYQSVSLNVSISNFSARSFYSHRGYSILESDPGEWSYYDDKGILRHMHEPGWRMSKDLGEYVDQNS
ncbi:MAG: GNAT family N-acetyltransferase [Chloroflexota bacterium]